MAEYIYATDEHEGHWLTGEEIVRCRDCTCCFTDELGTYCSLLDFQVADPGEQLDGFCAWGERRKR